jgi:hypothetical protein
MKIEALKCPKCESAMRMNSQFSTREVTLFVCTRCNGIATRDADGKPFVPTISTR